MWQLLDKTSFTGASLHDASQNVDRYQANDGTMQEQGDAQGHWFKGVLSPLWVQAPPISFKVQQSTYMLARQPAVRFQIQTCSQQLFSTKCGCAQIRKSQAQHA